MTALPIDNLPSHGDAPGIAGTHEGTHDHAHEDMGFLKKYIFSTDHKTIGIQFLLVGMFFFVVGGLLALLVRWQLGFQGHPVPILGAYMQGQKALGWENGTMPPDFYTMAFSMHGSLMIFFVVIPLLVGTFGNYLIPLKIGAADMAFPFLNGMAFWAAIPAGTIMVAAFFVKGGASQSGWTAYPPLSSIDMSLSGGTVDAVAPLTPWERMIHFLRIHESSPTLVTRPVAEGETAPSPFQNGVWTQEFAGDAEKMATVAGMVGTDLAANPTAGALKGASLVSKDKNGIVAKLADGTPVNITINRTGADGGTVAIKVGDGKQGPSGALMARMKKVLSDIVKPDAPDRWGWQSSWTAIPLLTNFFALFMAFLYICAYYVRIVPNSRTGVLFGLKKFVGTLALMAAGVLFLAFVLMAVFPDHRFTHLADGRIGIYGSLILLLLVVEGAILFFGGGINHHVSVALAGVAAYFALKGVQHAAYDGQSCWFLSVIILGFSSIMGAVNYLTTVVKLRCPGMTMFRLPLSVWALFITSILVLLATPVLAGVLTMNLLDHHRLTSFFQPFNWILSNRFEAGWTGSGVGVGTAGGGYPILHQHLFWFYSHPAVYIMILPAMGMVSDIMAVFARKPVFGYRPMIYALSAIAFLGFIVWAHHMFQSGMNPTLGTTFAISTMFIAVPSAIKTFNWLGTLWGGNIRFTTPMLNAVAFVFCFVIGGLSGIFMASTAIDVHIHDTYFIVAHIHYVLFGGSLFGIFAAVYFWYPKMFGRMMSEWLGQIHFWLTFVSFNCTFFAMHILGIGGMARRIADYMNYPSFQHWKPMNQFISISAFVLGAAQVPFLINFIGSWVWGKKAGNNPWEATTLEWNDCTSPPPHGNFTKVPVVHHGPYEYSSPLVEEDWLAQTREVEGAEQFAPVAH